MPLQATSGAASYDAYGGANPVVPNYIEDVFSTWLYTGNSSTQTITNGIDLSGKGGLVWIKARSNDSSNTLYDTVRGNTKSLYSNATTAESTAPAGYDLTSFNSNGFSLGPDWLYTVNYNNYTYVSWTFREQAKFFDVVTYTGNGTAGRTVSHNLGSTPGMIIIKRTNTGGVSSTWSVYHRSTGNDAYLTLNSSDAVVTGNSDRWNNTNPTSTQFTVGTDASVNQNNSTYVAYLFAHNAGGFGTAGTDNVISCGSFTCPSSGGVDVNLGYEPQYILTKKYNSAENWNVWDVMRGWAQLQQNQLFPNLSSAEDVYTGVNYFFPTATGFRLNSSFGLIGDYIYMAIRRPMKVPTTGTSVYKPTVFTGVDALQTAGFPVDFVFEGENIANTTSWYFQDRLRGGVYLQSTSTAAESAQSGAIFDSNTQVRVSDQGNSYKRSYNMFSRAPGFFDVVCYTGTGSATTQAHNLGVVPELMIVKCRSNNTTFWTVYAAPLGASQYLYLNATNAVDIFRYWNHTSPTSSVFSIGDPSDVNGSGRTYVAYLFATCAGVSKVGSYTGTGATQTINCGFSGGARFVLIKRTDSTGNWWVWDTARGMVASTDPRLALNSTAAEINNNWVYTTTGGFQIVTSDATVNASGGSYIFLAIA